MGKISTFFNEDKTRRFFGAIKTPERQFLATNEHMSRNREITLYNKQAIGMASLHEPVCSYNKGNLGGVCRTLRKANINFMSGYISTSCRY